MESLAISANIVFLSIFYTVFGACLSYVFFQLFDEYTPEWKKKTLGQQIQDICFELGLVGLAGQWTNEFIVGSAPIFPVSQALDHKVDNQVAGVFFIYGVMLFMNHLSTKIRHVYDIIFKKHFDNVLDETGSIIDLSLFASKTDKKSSD